MNNYLKYKPGWMQLLIFGSITICLNIIGGFIFYFILTGFYGIPASEVQHLDLGDPDLLPALKVSQVALSTITFLVPAAIFAYLSDKKPLEYLGIKSPEPKTFIFISIFILLVSFPVLQWLGDVNQHVHFPQKMQRLEKIINESDAQNNKLIKGFLDMKSPLDLIKILFIIGLLPAITEELFFRGVLQRLFILLLKKPWLGILFTAFIFSALHGFSGFLPRLVLGIILGTLYWYSGSLWPAFLFHLLNNSLQVIVVYFNPGLAEKNPNFSVLLVTASTFLVIGLIVYMKKISHTSFAEVYDNDDFHIGPRHEYKD